VLEGVEEIVLSRDEVQEEVQEEVQDEVEVRWKNALGPGNISLACVHVKDGSSEASPAASCPRSHQLRRILRSPMFRGSARGTTCLSVARRSAFSKLSHEHLGPGWSVPT
jgi:phage terminase large subunit GpA-like protein